MRKNANCSFADMIFSFSKLEILQHELRATSYLAHY